MGRIPNGVVVAAQVCFWASSIVLVNRGHVGPPHPDAPTEVPDVTKLLRVAQAVHTPFDQACGVLGTHATAVAVRVGARAQELAWQAHADMAVAVRLASPWVSKALLAFMLALAVCVGGATMLAVGLAWVANHRLHRWRLHPRTKCVPKHGHYTATLFWFLGCLLMHPAEGVRWAAADKHVDGGARIITVRAIGGRRTTRVLAWPTDTVAVVLDRVRTMHPGMLSQEMRLYDCRSTRMLRRWDRLGSSSSFDLGFRFHGGGRRCRETGAIVNHLVARTHSSGARAHANPAGTGKGKGKGTGKGSGKGTGKGAAVPGGNSAAGNGASGAGRVPTCCRLTRACHTQAPNVAHMHACPPRQTQARLARLTACVRACERDAAGPASTGSKRSRQTYGGSRGRGRGKRGRGRARQGRGPPDKEPPPAKVPVPPTECVICTSGLGTRRVSAVSQATLVRCSKERGDDKFAGSGNPPTLDDHYHVECYRTYTKDSQVKKYVAQRQASEATPRRGGSASAAATSRDPTPPSRNTRAATGDADFDIRTDCYFCGRAGGQQTKAAYIENKNLSDAVVSRKETLGDDQWGDAVFRRTLGVDFVVRHQPCAAACVGAVVLARPPFTTVSPPSACSPSHSASANSGFTVRAAFCPPSTCRRPCTCRPWTRLATSNAAGGFTAEACNRQTCAATMRPRLPPPPPRRRPRPAGRRAPPTSRPTRRSLITCAATTWNPTS